MKTTIFAVLFVAVLVPRASFATPARVDNSDYGMQSSTDCTASVQNFTSFAPTCFSAGFLAKNNLTYQGFLLGFEEQLISDVEVEFSHANIYDTGLETCDTDLNGSGACLARSNTWSLNVATHDINLFTSNIASGLTPPLNLVDTSAIFDLNGIIDTHSETDKENENRVAFLLLCTPAVADTPAATDCDGVHITVTSLAATATTPEPGSLFLCGSGALMLARRVRNRRRN